MKKTHIVTLILIIISLFISSTPLTLASHVGDTSWVGDTKAKILTDTTMGSLVPVVKETGKVSLSIDGLGTLTDSGIVQVEKPVGATVRNAFLAAASTGFTGAHLNNGDILLDGNGVNWNIETPSNILSFNYWAEVTPLVKPKVDSAAAGRVDFTVTEQIGTHLVDGVILAVIFNDPNQVVDNTVVLLFGAQDVKGDTFSISLSDPLDLSDPNIALDLSLGISYSYQPNNQFSKIVVNDARLTTSAGGQDDGDPVNGALLTVGGLDDANANPPDPLKTDHAGPLYDDELYNLLPFLSDGVTNIKIYTMNPSNDDNIFFAAMFLGSMEATVWTGPGFSIPEFPLGTIAGLLTFVSALLVYRRKVK